MRTTSLFVLITLLGLSWGTVAAGMDDFFLPSLVAPSFPDPVAGLDLVSNKTSANIQVNDVSMGEQHQPAVVATSGGIIYVVWTDFRNDPNGPGTGEDENDIYFAKSVDGGLTFSASVRVSDDNETGLNYAPKVATNSNGNIYVVWHDNRDGNWNVYFSKSTDGGVSFSTNVQVLNDPDTQYEADLAVDNQGNVYVTWNHLYTDVNEIMDYDVYFAKSTDEGLSFGNSVKVSDGEDWQYKSSIKVGASGPVYVVWTDRRNNGVADIYFAKSTDGGTTFSANLQVNSYTSNSQGYPELALDDDENIYVVWNDSRRYYTDECRDIYFSRSTNQGGSFEAGIRVNDVDIPKGIEYLYPSLALKSGRKIYVSWWDDRSGDLDVYLTGSYDGGGDFFTSWRINDDVGTASQYNSKIAVDESGNVYVVWLDTRNPDYPPDVYFACFFPCDGDFDHDGDVDGSDLAVFAADFGRTDCCEPNVELCEGDFDVDGDVDGSDLAVFAADFGRTDCPSCP